MRIDDFHNLLTLDTVQAVDLHEMRSLLERHPYSHVVRLAYLKSLHAADDDRLGQAMDEAAVHLPDRRVLHAFMERLASIDKVVDPDSNEPPELASTEPIEKDTSKALQRQYLTEAVQSSILLEVAQEAVHEETEAEIEEKEKEVEETIPPASFLDFIAGESANRDLSHDAVGSDEVISRFLKNEKREKTAFFDPERMAKKSLDDTGGMVSDTLARIYINQGNLDKAMEAYKQLILKYPEKSGYFAARIQKVEELKRKK